MIAGAEVDGLARALLLLGLGMLATLAIREHPRWGAALWLGTLCLVPVWIGEEFGVFLTDQILVTLGVLLALSLRTAGGQSGLQRAAGRITWVDVISMGFFAACGLGMVTGRWSGPVLFAVLSVWVLGYLFGRVLPGFTGGEWLRTAVGLALAGVALLAVLEAATSWNPFVGLSEPNPLYAAWGWIQTRGGQARVEGAFGHSIALGCAVALAIPFVMTSPFRLFVKTLMLVTMGVAVVATLSRIAMVCAVLAVALTAVFGRLPRRERIGFAAALGLGAVVMLPRIASVMASAGEEASKSAAYRSSLASLIPDIDVLGQSEMSYTSPSGKHYWGNYKSVDSALLLVGLHFGWIALGLAVMLLIGALVSLRRGRTAPEVIGLVSLIPAYLSVAFITQYALLVWFVVGMAAHSLTRPYPDLPYPDLPYRELVTQPGARPTSVPADPDPLDPHRPPRRKAPHAHA